MSIPAFLNRLRRQTRALVRNLPGIRHNIAAARKARLTRNAHRSGDMMRKYIRKSQ